MYWSRWNSLTRAVMPGPKMPSIFKRGSFDAFAFNATCTRSIPSPYSPVLQNMAAQRLAAAEADLARDASIFLRGVLRLGGRGCEFLEDIGYRPAEPVLNGVELRSSDRLGSIRIRLISGSAWIVASRRAPIRSLSSHVSVRVGVKFHGRRG